MVNVHPSLPVGARDAEAVRTYPPRLTRHYHVLGYPGSVLMSEVL